MPPPPNAALSNPPLSRKTSCWAVKKSGCDMFDRYSLLAPIKPRRYQPLVTAAAGQAGGGGGNRSAASEALLSSANAAARPKIFPCPMICSLVRQGPDEISRGMAHESEHDGK